MNALALNKLEGATSIPQIERGPIVPPLEVVAQWADSAMLGGHAAVVKGYNYTKELFLDIKGAIKFPGGSA